MQREQFELHARIERSHWWFAARRTIVRRLLNRLVPPGQGVRLVDVGCGTGGNLFALADDYRCLGIDTSAAAIELAKRRFPDVEFLCGWAPDDIRPELSEARIVLLMDVLEHVPDDFAMLARLWEAASPGTLFLITVPADPRLWSPHDQAFGHYRRYTRQRFERLWQQLPANCWLSSGLNARLQGAIRTVRWLSRWRGAASGAAGTDFQVPGPRVNRLLLRTFAGEADRLLAALEGSGRPYQSGVSWLAVLERVPGPCPVQSRPSDVAADEHDPQALLAVAGR